MTEANASVGLLLATALTKLVLVPSAVLAFYILHLPRAWKPAV